VTPRAHMRAAEHPRAWQPRAFDVTGQPASFGVRNGPDRRGIDRRNQSWDSFLMLALISVNLGLINLLPIPMLDGGHLLVFAVEGARRRPSPRAPARASSSPASSSSA
jgi:membrane-associated protease RseP (regulator of RpoE activity)